MLDDKSGEANYKISIPFNDEGRVLTALKAVFYWLIRVDIISYRYIISTISGADKLRL